MAALRNFNGLATWRNAENSLQSVNLRMPAHRICRTRQLHAARHIVPARVHPSPRACRVRTPCRLPRAVALRNACTGQPPAVPGRAACSCHSRSYGTVRHLCRRKVCRLENAGAPHLPHCPGLRVPCALGLAPLLAATLAQAVIRHGPGLSASWTHAAGEAFGGNAFITPPPARTFFIGVFVWHAPPFRG